MIQFRYETTICRWSLTNAQSISVMASSARYIRGGTRYVPQYTLKVNHIPSFVTERQVLQVFRRYGSIASVSVKHGYAYVNFRTQSCAEAAYKHVHNTEQWGSTITIVRQYDVPGQVTVPEPPSQYTVKVSNLPANATEYELELLCVNIHSIKLNEGFGYINFMEPSDAKNAADILNGHAVRGVVIKAKLISKPHQHHWSTQPQVALHKAYEVSDSDDVLLQDGIPKLSIKPLPKPAQLSTVQCQYTIKISNLPNSVTEDELKQLHVCRKCQSIRVNKGHCFVNFNDINGAVDAANFLNGYKLHGFTLTVKCQFDYCQSQQQSHKFQCTSSGFGKEQVLSLPSQYQQSHFDKLQQSYHSPKTPSATSSRTVKVSIHGANNLVSADDLEAFFSKYGKIVQKVIINFGRPNFAYINYETSEQAHEASKANGISFNDASLTVKVVDKEVVITKELACDDILINRLFGNTYCEEIKAKFSLDKCSLNITPLNKGGIKVIGDQSMISLCESYFQLKVKEIKSMVISSSQKFHCNCIPFFQDQHIIQDIEKASSVAFSITTTHGDHKSLVSFGNFIREMTSPLLLECCSDYLLTTSPAHSTSAQWCYEGDDGTYVKMSHSDSMAVEAAKLQSKGTCTIGKWTYAYNFHAMTQTNISTGKIRKIRCDRNLDQAEIAIHCRGLQSSVKEAIDMLTSKVQKAMSTTDIQLPPGIPPQAMLTEAKTFCVSAEIVLNTLNIKSCQPYLQLVKGHLINFKPKFLLQSKCSTNGPYWEPQNDDIELKRVHPGSQEWNKVETEMKMSIPTVALIRIERIQNLYLWNKYALCKEQMNKKNQGIINEKMLFHGTGNTPPRNIYRSEHGFDFRFSRDTCLWGKGAYFAKQASYSAGSYCWHEGNYKQLLVAYVLTGHSAKSGTNSQLVMPPLKSGLTGERYDSVNGISGNTKIYVVYDHDKSYPAYLITFT